MSCQTILAAIAVCCSVSLATSRTDAATLYVATNGNDAWSGHLAQPNRAKTDGPFASIQRARDEVRKMKREGLTGGITVEIAGGIYQMSGPLEFTAADSGAAAAPIEYRATPGAPVRLVGGRVVSGFKPVTDPQVLARLDPSARGKVVVADLPASGVTDLQGINSASVYQSDPGLEVFFQDKPMTLARYPNAGYMHIKSALDADGNPKPPSAIVTTPGSKFICDDPRPARWANEKDIWLHGFWTYDWADSRIPLGSVDAATNTISLGAGNAAYGIRTGQWFYAQNVLPELDTPGEWYVDRDSSKLYFWPPAPLSAGKVMVSSVRDLIRLDNVSHVTFRGLMVEAGRGTAMLIKGGTNVRAVACTFRNMGNWAVRVAGGTNHGVVGCDIYGMGQGGVYLEGGDRKTLTPAGHYADNNHIHHTSRWDPVYQQAIALRGVGNSATHNLIDNVPHIAIGFADNDMTVEYNEIHSSVYQSNDAGAIYTSPPDETWSMRGQKIRYNYLHNIHGFEGRGCLGVYLDDCFSSADISGNIFNDVATAILIGGGRDNLITNNMFVNCRQAYSIDARGLGWAKGVGTFATKELLDLNYKQPPWSIHYPELLNILEDEPLAPKGNVVARNVNWGGKWGWIEPKAEPGVKVEDNLIDVDPMFAGKPAAGWSAATPADFRLKRESPAWKLGFKHLPLANIGVYKSPDRASWPVTSVLRQDALPPAAKPKPARPKSAIPTFSIPRATAAITIDGKLTPDEWFGLDAARGLVIQEGVDGEKCKFKSLAWLAYDDQALYVAFDNAVDKTVPMALENSWGSNDATEISLSKPGAKAPILVLRGFAGGAFQSSDEAGAPADLARKAGEGVVYKATVIDKGRWVAEFRIPFASLGIKPGADVSYPFNLAVRKMGDEAWVMWRGTGGCTWLVPEAGLVKFGR
jgi:hypothetical protein